jgi:hypothetical protein
MQSGEQPDTPPGGMGHPVAQPDVVSVSAQP